MAFIATVPYSDIANADLWLNEIIDISATAWGISTDPQKERQLRRATQIIDSLGDFCGERTVTDGTQLRQFPRGGDTDIPEAVEKACALFAFELANGKTPDALLNQGNVASEAAGSASVSYVNGGGSASILGIVPSEEAYQLLAPYRFDPNQGRTERG